MAQTPRKARPQGNSLSPHFGTVHKGQNVAPRKDHYGYVPPARVAAPAVEARGLFSWRPLQLVLLLLLVIPGYAAVKMVQNSGHFIEGALQVETDGATGTISGNQLTVDLPVQVYNGTQQVILGVSLWVDAYACAETNSKLADCKKVLSTGVDFATNTAQKGSSKDSRQLTAGVPDDLPGRTVKVLSRVVNTDTDVDLNKRQMEERVANRKVDPDAP
jgi:hypothetical protein